MRAWRPHGAQWWALLHGTLPACPPDPQPQPAEPEEAADKQPAQQQGVPQPQPAKQPRHSFLLLHYPFSSNPALRRAYSLPPGQGHNVTLWLEDMDTFAGKGRRRV